MSIEMKKVNIPCLDGEGTLNFESFGAKFQEAIDTKISLYAIKKLPEDALGKGAVGKVYRAGSIVYKVRGQFLLPKPPDVFVLGASPPLIGRQEKGTMIASFEDALDRVKAHQTLPKSPHYPECRGLVYIAEFNVWAVAHDFIEGSDLAKAKLEGDKARKMWAGLCKGLQTLDESGYPYNDLDASNILIRPDGTPVLFDDIASGKSKKTTFTSEYSRECLISLAGLPKYTVTPSWEALFKALCP